MHELRLHTSLAVQCSNAINVYIAALLCVEGGAAETTLLDGSRESHAGEEGEEDS